ncbi:MAG: hypothetical protein NTU98_06340 [Bacteroidetes bacterium]|nr:hypothetical protein [Bacteroidota bacterium]
MKIRFILIVFILFIIPRLILGQTWIKIYCDNMHVCCYRIHEQYDHGFLLTGYQNSGWTSYGLAKKININGDELWTMLYGKIGEYNQFNASCKLIGGKMIYCGSTNKLNSNCYDPMIVKVNACGEKEWCKIYNSSFCSSFCIDIKSTFDGGFMILLQQWISPSDVWLFRTDSLGEIQWVQEYVSNSAVYNSPDARALLYTSDSCFVITGDAYSPDSLMPGYWILKIFHVKVKNTGEIIFEYPWGMNNATISDYPNTPVEDNKHHLYTPGRLARNVPPYGDGPCLFKTGVNGYPEFYKDLIGNSYSGGAGTINWFTDSTLVFNAAWSVNTGISDTTAALKTDRNGNLLKEKVLFTNTPTIFLTNSEITHNNRVIFTGFLETVPSSGALCAFAAKLNSELEFDSSYLTPLRYDSLCPHPVVSDTVSLDDCAVVTSVYNFHKEPEKSKLHIYPDPAKEFVTIELPQYLVAQTQSIGIKVTTAYQQWTGALLQIYDIYDKLLFSEIVNQSTKTVKPDITSWHAGIYVARLVFQKETVSREKFIIEK